MPSNKTPTAKTKTTSTTNPTLLVLEDNVDLLSDTVQLARLSGFDVLEARWAAEAIDLIGTLKAPRHLDAALIDIMVPEDEDSFTAVTGKLHERTQAVMKATAEGRNTQLSVEALKRLRNQLEVIDKAISSSVMEYGGLEVLTALEKAHGRDFVEKQCVIYTARTLDGVEYKKEIERLRIKDWIENVRIIRKPASPDEIEEFLQSLLNGANGEK